MKHISISLLLWALLGCYLNAQYRLPVIKEITKVVSIKDGDTLVNDAPDYLKILKKAAKYNTSDRRTIPQFTYQSSNDPNLVTLRTTFNLDSIAGKGNEVSKMLNLLHWVHNLIQHDGNKSNPEIKNAKSMISVCKKEHRGLNCRGLAIILNECYLAMGFQSRFVTCMQKDTVFKDCHVINMVFSKDLNKWLWMDPTNDAYVMNEKGELLSIQEVRERIINGKPLLLNPDANWNHRCSINKKEYLYSYMAKNLYRMECSVVSEYDSETREKGRVSTYVELLPLNAYNQTPQRIEYTGKKTETIYVKYKTNNPDLFWAKPIPPLTPPKEGNKSDYK